MLSTFQERIVLQHDAAVEVETKLGIPISVLNDIAKIAHGAYLSATSSFPATSKKTLAYHHAVSALRDKTFMYGFDHYKDGSLEGVVSEDGTKVIFYQNVDVACTSKTPKCPRRPDAGSLLEQTIKRINKPTRYLFDEHERDYERKLLMLKQLADTSNSDVWFLCVASSPKGCSFEISSPVSLYKGQFTEMKERIFLGSYASFDDIPDLSVDNGEPEQAPVDTEVVITRKI